MQDLLSLALSDQSFYTELFQYWQADIKRVPMHVWLRLLADMRVVLIEKANGCLTWYHRQLKETCENHLFTAAEIVQIQRYLGLYFSDQVDVDIRAERMISRQPLTLNGVPVWFKGSKVNCLLYTSPSPRDS